MSKRTPTPLGVLIEIMAKKHPHPLIENEYPPKSRRRRCSKEALCAAGQKGAPILFRACARRAAGDGVCRGSAVAAGRPPGGPPEAQRSSVPRRRYRAQQHALTFSPTFL